MMVELGSWGTECWRCGRDTTVSILRFSRGDFRIWLNMWEMTEIYAYCLRMMSNCAKYSEARSQSNNFPHASDTTSPRAHSPNNGSPRVAWRFPFMLGCRWLLQSTISWKYSISPLKGWDCMNGLLALLHWKKVEARSKSHRPWRRWADDEMVDCRTKQFLQINRTRLWKIQKKLDLWSIT